MLDGRQLSFELDPAPLVVVVEQSDHAPVRGIDSQLPTSGGSDPTFAAQHHDAVVRRQGHGQIGVRDHDDLGDRIRLLESGLHSAVQGRPTERGDHDAHTRSHDESRTATIGRRTRTAQKKSVMQANSGIMLYVHGA